MGTKTPTIPSASGRELTELPTPIVAAGPAPQEALFARQRDSKRATFDAAGVALVVFGPAPNDYYWLVQGVVIVTTSAAVTQARIYVGSPIDANLSDASDQGNLDISDRNHPIVVPGGETLSIRWTGGTVGTFATANIQRQLAQLV